MRVLCTCDCGPPCGNWPAAAVATSRDKANKGGSFIVARVAPVAMELAAKVLVEVFLKST